MDILTFITKLIDSLAWPVAAIVLIILLRKEIGSIIPFIKKLKVGPVEAEFDREVKELTKETENEIPAVKTFLPTDRQGKLLQLSQINPRSAIIEAWQGIEFAATKALPDKALDFAIKERSPNATIRALTKFDVLNKFEISLLYDLRALRNQAVHDEQFDPSHEAVSNFIQLAAYLQSKLEQQRQM